MLADGEHKMPGYPGSSQAILIRDNQQLYLWNNESVRAGTASIACQVERVNRSFYPWGISLEIFFSGNPGAFEVDLQDADIDQDSHYVTVDAITAGLNASYVTRIELPSFYTKYVRVKLVTLTNSVNISVLLTR
jgi:hypothetical protein